MIIRQAGQMREKNIIQLKTLKGISRVEEMVAAQLVAHMEIQFQT